MSTRSTRPSTSRNDTPGGPDFSETSWQALVPGPAGTVVKAPTLVCDDGTVLMDSTLILQYAEARLSGGRSLWNPDPGQLAHEYRVVGLSLAACEKSAQLIYERNLRERIDRAAQIDFLEADLAEREAA